MQKTSNSFPVDKEGDTKKIPYPKSIIFIIGNEFCERFSFYGMRTILVLYFRFILFFSEDSATEAFHIFVMACYFTPIFGAILSDSYLGKYWTILSISCIYAAGSIILSFASIVGTAWLSFIGLTLIALGTGGIKPCVSVFGGDQFQAGQEHQLQNFFSLFYIAINLGSLISTFLTPILRQDIVCFGRSDCYPLAFGIPAILMVIALGLFILGKITTGYIIYPPDKDNIVFKVFACVFRAIYRKFSSNGPKKNHWIDYANDKYDKKTRNDVKALMRILFLYLPLPIFWALFDQQASRWTLQAIRMNRQLGSNFIVKPDQIQVISPLLVIIFIPVFDYMIYPLMGKVGLNKPLKRMVIGGLLAALSFGICGFLQTKIETEEPVKLMADYNHLAIINGAQKDLSITFLNIIMKPYDVKIIPNMKRQQLKDMFLKNQNSSIELKDGKSLIIYYKDENKSINFFFENILTKPDAGGSKIFTLFDLKNYQGQTFTISGMDNVLEFKIVDDSTENKIGNLESFEVDIMGKSIIISVGQKHMTYPSLGQGASYIQIIQGDMNSDQELNLHITKIIDENKLSVFLQLIQYLIMTSAEIMFSITGLEFSYSQAPKSMKSILQAAWLLTVAFGNLIVAIIAKAKFEKQSYEFFFFGGLMLIDITIFAVMAYFYVPFQNIEDDNKDNNESNSLSLEPITSSNGTKALQEKI